ncbi:lanthionine synthetase C family protein [Actinoplanes sp. NPDC051859]|uniref:lanthionine synthetase C family protein n=1 Tax=Actinoplanes sp. NPDC051859 TaxID=3363909 RepID=UPI0037BC8AF4
MTQTLTALADSGAVLEHAARQLTDPAVVRPSPDGRIGPQSLAGGAAGIALLHLERAAAGTGDDATARTWVRAAAAGPVSAGPNANLFHGAPTLALMLHTAAGVLGGYQHTFAAVDERTTALTRDRLAAAHDRIDRGLPLPMREFDLVHGLTGLGVYHLRAHPDQPITRDVLAYLVRLTEPLTGPDARVDWAGRPPWWLDSGLAGMPNPQFPHGHGNLGVAHGISAVIALLALSVLGGHEPPGARDALTRLCAWTDLYHRHDHTGPWWPGWITDHCRPERQRPSWCYGTAGTARAHHLAGLALNDPARQHQAETAMLAALRHRTGLTGIGLCHGIAGLLQAAWRTATTSRHPAMAVQLRAELLALTSDLARQLGTEASGSPEFMDGAAGAALALHTFHADACVTGWDAFLLLS